MPYQFKTRLPYIGTRMQEVFGEVVTYARGANNVILRATPAHTDLQDLIPEVIITAVRYVDFIILATDLVIPTVGNTLPVAGDLITWQGSVYTVTPPAQSDDCYQFTTMLRDRLRIHTLKST